MKRLFFIEMMGGPNSYDASVYDHFFLKDNEGKWFAERFGGFPNILIKTRNVCTGEPLPEPHEVDGLVLAGTYNSVHDNTVWQQQVRRWLPIVRSAKIPILAVCGSHQLLAQLSGATVEAVRDAPCAGSFPIELEKGASTSRLMHGIKNGDVFQYANSEHVSNLPDGSVLLVSSERVPFAALDYGNHCYSTQFHPEGTCETLRTVWRNSQPNLMKNYRNEENGRRLVHNFLRIVSD